MPVTGALWPGRATWGKQDGPRQSPGQGGSATFCSWAHGPSDQHTAAAIRSTTHLETQRAEGPGPLGSRGVGAGAGASGPAYPGGPGERGCGWSLSVRPTPRTTRRKGSRPSRLLDRPAGAVLCFQRSRMESKAISRGRALLPAAAAGASPGSPSAFQPRLSQGSKYAATLT